MKLVTYRTPAGAERCGVLDGGDVVAIEGVESMLALYALGAEGMELARRADGPRDALEAVTLLAPIGPRKFFHTAGNFGEHHDESKRVSWSHPVLPWIVFFQNVDAIIGPDAPIVYPSHLTRELDHELELAVVIRKAGKHFGPEEASDYIGGFVIFNDITARDIQRTEMKSGVFSFCKAIDTFCPLGPWIVTPDEIPDPHALRMQLRVNGELRQDSSTRNMSYTIPEIIAHYSPLGYSAGDVLSTGTVSGVAGFREDAENWYLRPGDVVECEIEGIGILRNPIIPWDEAHPAPVFPPAPAVTVDDHDASRDRAGAAAGRDGAGNSSHA